MIFFCGVHIISPIALGCRITLVASIYLLSLSNLYGQDRFARSLTLGTSYTYIWNQTSIAPSVNETTHQEFTWNTNIALEVLPKWHLGFQYMNIRSISERNANRQSQHQLFGLFNQYDFYTSQNGIRLFGEAQYKYGDYCTCGQLDPFVLEDLHYLGLGGGVEVPLYKRLKLDLAFYNSVILNNVPLKYNFTQYVIGLNYRLMSK